MARRAAVTFRSNSSPPRGPLGPVDLLQAVDVEVPEHETLAGPAAAVEVPPEGGEAGLAVEDPGQLVTCQAVALVGAVGATVALVHADRVQGRGPPLPGRGLRRTGERLGPPAGEKAHTGIGLGTETRIGPWPTTGDLAGPTDVGEGVALRARMELRTRECPGVRPDRGVGHRLGGGHNADVGVAPDLGRRRRDDLADEFGPESDDPAQLAGHEVEDGVAFVGVEMAEAGVQEGGAVGQGRGHLEEPLAGDDGDVVEERLHFRDRVTRDGREPAAPHPDAVVEVLHVRNPLSNRLQR